MRNIASCMISMCMCQTDDFINNLLTRYLVAVGLFEGSPIRLSIGASSGAIGRSLPVLAASPCSCP